MYLGGRSSKKNDWNSGEPNLEITQQTALVCVCLSNSSELYFHHTFTSLFPFFGMDLRVVCIDVPTLQHSTCRSEEPISIVVHSIKHRFQLFLASTEPVAQLLEGRLVPAAATSQLSSLLPSNIFNQPFLKVSKSILKDRSIILVRAKGGGD